MRWIRLLIRIFGWLLTPLLAWAASFFGAVGGALIALRMADPVHGLIVTAACGGLAGFVTVIAWLRYLRRSPEVREALAVTEDGMPDTTELSVVVLAVLGSMVLAPAAEAQTIAGQVGRFHAEGRWSGYRLGFGGADAGFIGVQLQSEVFQRNGGADEGFAGLGIDVTALRSRRGGPYLIGGIGAGRAATANGHYDESWASWSLGAGYELFPAPFLSLGVESRWRWLSFGKRDGLELMAGIGLHFGGRRLSRPAAPAVPRAPRPQIDPRAPARSPAATPTSLRDSIVATAVAVMGRPYEWGGSGADSGGFDCSGLIHYAFGRHGITLPRRSVDQARTGASVAKELGRLQPGDLLTFSNRGGAVTHVGLYLGEGAFIHSATGGVQTSVLSDDDPYGRWWYQRWVGARRLID